MGVGGAAPCAALPVDALLVDDCAVDAAVPGTLGSNNSFFTGAVVAIPKARQAMWHCRLGKTKIDSKV